MDSFNAESTAEEPCAALLPMCWLGSFNETTMPVETLINFDQSLQSSSGTDNIDHYMIGKYNLPNLSLQHLSIGDLQEPEVQCDNADADALLYFKVPDIKLKDLFDWSEKLNKSFHGGLVRPSPKMFRRQRSTSGSVANVNGETIALFRLKDSVFAVFEKCPHAGGPLHLGDIEALPETGRLCIKCPWHSWKIDLHTGDIVHPKTQKEKARTFKTVVDSNGNIWIGFDRFHADYFNPRKISF